MPLNYRLGDQQLEQLVANHPGAFFVTDPAEAVRLAALGTAKIDCRPMGEWLAYLSAAPTDSAAEFPDVDDADDAAAVFIYTSGTTAAPKGVVIKHSNLLSYVFSSVEFGAAGTDEAALISVPP